MIHRALRLTPDHWMIPHCGDNMANGRRFVLEGRLISVAHELVIGKLQHVRLPNSVTGTSPSTS